MFTLIDPDKVMASESTVNKSTSVYIRYMYLLPNIKNIISKTTMGAVCIARKLMLKLRVEPGIVLRTYRAPRTDSRTGFFLAYSIADRSRRK